MGNTYECGKDEPCIYWEAIHGLNGHSIYEEKFKERCRFCSRPTRERFAGHGIYPPAGGFNIEEEVNGKSD